MTHHVPGTAGYAEAVDRFVAATLAIDFAELHRDFLPFVPRAPARILDVGAGIGRDASVLARQGHDVTAVEPDATFLAAGRERYDAPNIDWIGDALPGLATLGDRPQFGFVLASAMWHHLNLAEQRSAIGRVAELLYTGGVLALSLRHGVAGVGTRVFPTCGKSTIEEAAKVGFVPLLHQPDRPSLMPGKVGVRWTRVVLQKLDRVPSTPPTP
ncbi:MAG: class I SAM-dependent methyltransferase [Geitlerinemataceae cyanobacterium]